ncbi:holo-[acyl-carrier-protein] synthase [Salicibibacter halophilus]|uniref:Holo-[acyl-carrier-protein] synthase n=1 Tax=Salicibibacter halophilus TaxID=2502791 RepID=A0A514LKU4_9BACI|nr:holo-ACP synthase [Salicibibacter halophilus]QDI92467.1 holo-[acyl-carrier-protein] synthase [Salicibibacter halophilus]
MIVGTGIDISECKRIEAVISRQPRFITRILTVEERKGLDGMNDRRKIEFITGRFAIKEAFAKANGSGIGEAVNWKDVEVFPAQNGAPMLVCPKLDESIRVHASISHSHAYAIGQVILERA